MRMRISLVPRLLFAKRAQKIWSGKETTCVWLSCLPSPSPQPFRFLQVVIPYCIPCVHWTLVKAFYHAFTQVENVISHPSCTPFSTNPVEDRAKYWICTTFGSILYGIGGEQSMKGQISCILEIAYRCPELPTTGSCSYTLPSNISTSTASVLIGNSSSYNATGIYNLFQHEPCAALLAARQRKQTNLLSILCPRLHVTYSTLCCIHVL